MLPFFQKIKGSSDLYFIPFQTHHLLKIECVDYSLEDRGGFLDTMLKYKVLNYKGEKMIGTVLSKKDNLPKAIFCIWSDSEISAILSDDLREKIPISLVKFLRNLMKELLLRGIPNLWATSDFQTKKERRFMELFNLKDLQEG